MDKKNISDVEAKTLYTKAKNVLIEISRIRKINFTKEEHELDELKDFFIENIYNNPIPFNNKDLFVDLFKYYLLNYFSVEDFKILFNTLNEFYNELEINNIEEEYCFRIISLIMTRDRLSGISSFTKFYALKLINLFNNKEYLFNLLSYIFKNIESFKEIGLNSLIDLLEELKCLFIDELEFYKVCIYVINEIKNNKTPTSIYYFIKDVYRLNYIELNDDVIKSFNNNIEIKENLKDRIRKIKEKQEEITKKEESSISNFDIEKNKIYQEIEEKRNNYLMNELESNLKNVNLNTLYEQMIENREYLKYIGAWKLLKLFLIEDKINFYVNWLGGGDSVFTSCKWIAKRLNIKNIKYYNIKDMQNFIDEESLDIIVNGGVLFFDLLPYCGTPSVKQGPISNIPLIEDYIYYNNNHYKVSDKLKIILITNIKYIENYITLDYVEKDIKRMIK